MSSRPDRGAGRRAGALGALAALALGALAPAPVVASAGAAGTQGHVRRSSLLRSRELWATIDVCNPADQPDTVGIRGSMPGDGHPRDAMYMRFQLQYLNAATRTWSTPAHGADSGFVAVGPARSPREGGSSFKLGAPPGKPGYTMRGVVTFQWRRGSQVVHQATRTTGAGHQSVAGADPKGYSTAECVIP